MAQRCWSFPHNLLALRLIKSKSFHRNVSTSADFLLSIENKNRCLECMKKLAPINIKRKQTTHREEISAAVLIPICIDAKGETSILYTRRSGLISRHKWQIAFPGGIKDDSDADFIECALRETEEEIGLSRRYVDVWGTGNLVKPPHTAAIMPVFGTVENLDEDKLQLNTAEVHEAFTIPIASLIAADNQKHTQFKSGYSAPTFIVDKYRVWGITGFITHHFLNCFVPRERRSQVKFIKPLKV